jgi:SAM-dependent methyltransferase
MATSAPIRSTLRSRRYCAPRLRSLRISWSTHRVKQHAAAADRNREPIREVLARELPASGTVLEIASGTGEHAVAFARAFPHLTWQPTDVDPIALSSIAAWRDEAALPNLAAPSVLDVMRPWPFDRADAIVCINMVHIAPWNAALALFANAGRILVPGALLYLYGPYRFDGRFTAASNAAFDQSLRARDPQWGVRDVHDLTTAASSHGLTLRDAIAMPANNHSLVFRLT